MHLTISFMAAALAGVLYLLFTGNGPEAGSLADKAESRQKAIEEAQALAFGK